MPFPETWFAEGLEEEEPDPAPLGVLLLELSLVGGVSGLLPSAGGGGTKDAGPSDEGACDVEDACDVDVEGSEEEGCGGGERERRRRCCS